MNKAQFDTLLARLDTLIELFEPKKPPVKRTPRRKPKPKAKKDG